MSQVPNFCVCCQDLVDPEINGLTDRCQDCSGNKKTFIDPPSGWRYGFPKELKPGKSAKDLLLESGYPEKDVEFALQYCRQWKE